MPTNSYPFPGKSDVNLNSDVLFSVFILPLISFIIIFIFSNYWTTKSQYQFSLIISGISFICSLILVGALNFGKSGFQETFYFNIVPSFSIALRIGVDGISIFFIILTNLFIFLCILSLTPTTFKLNEALLYLFFLQWGVLGTFLALDLLGFFIFFEMTLIPIYFLVLLWGSRERRVRASYLISIYTLLGSIFRFFNLLYIYSKTGTTD